MTEIAQERRSGLFTGPGRWAKFGRFMGFSIVSKQGLDPPALAIQDARATSTRVGGSQHMEMKYEGRRIQKVAADRCGRRVDRFRDRKAGGKGPRHPRRGEGDLGEPGRLQGPQARRPT